MTYSPSESFTFTYANFKIKKIYDMILAMSSTVWTLYAPTFCALLTIRLLRLEISPMMIHSCKHKHANVEIGAS